MSTADKRRAIEAMLRDEEWRGFADNAIAKELGVSNHTVAKVREELFPGWQNANLTETRTGKDGKSHPAKKKAKPAPEPKPPTFADELAAVVAASPKVHDNAIYTAITHAFEAKKITESERDHLADLWTKHDPAKTEGAGGLTTSAALTPNEGTSAEDPEPTHQTQPASSEKPATPQPMPTPAAPSRGPDGPNPPRPVETAESRDALIYQLIEIYGRLGLNDKGLLRQSLAAMLLGHEAELGRLRDEFLNRAGERS
jgi:hypothetical protein